MKGALRRTQIMNYTLKSGGLVSNAFGTITVSYSLLHSLLSNGEDFCPNFICIKLKLFTVSVLEDNDEANTMISGTLTGLFFKSTSGMKKCARGGLVSNFSWKFMEIIVICIISDWIWIKCSLGAGFEEARNSSAFHLICQLLGQTFNRIIIKHKFSCVTACLVLSCMNVILRVFRFGHYLRHW